MNRGFVLLAALMLALSPSVSLSQTRPLLTEEASTALAGSFIVESGVDFMGGMPNFLTDQPRDMLNGPMLRLVYSPADNVECDVEWVAQVTALDDERFGTATDFGDVSLRTKVALQRGSSSRPALAVRLAMTLPQTSAERGLGPNTIRTLVDFLLTHELGGARLHANVGLALQDQVGGSPAQCDFLAYGLALEKRVNAQVGFMAEIAGLLGKGSQGTDAHSGARLGFRFSGTRFRWDFAACRGLTRASGTWGVTAGLTWTARQGTPPPDRNVEE